MKIATYNVNGINARLPVLLRWLEEKAPDIVCLQELKSPDEKIPKEALSKAGYHAIWHGQKRWNGVAILAKHEQPQQIIQGLPGEPEDEQSRYLEATISGIRVACLYLPNGNPAPGPKYDYKLRWLERFEKRAKELIDLEEPVVITGDFNIIPTELDVYKPERWVDDALFRPEVREVFQRLQEQGWKDAIRQLYPEKTIYTYFDYFRNAYQRNAGLRIDHFLINPKLVTRVKDAGVDLDIRGWEKTSDHAPVWLHLKDLNKES
jgi:exodeoxyribonuclease III